MTAEYDNMSKWHAVRSKRIFQVVQYNWIIFPVATVITYNLFFLLFNNPELPFFHIPTDSSLTFTRDTILWMVLALPNRPMGLLSFFGAWWPCRPFRLNNQPVKRSFNRLLICLVTRGDQQEIVERSVAAIQDLYKKVDDRVSLHVLCEEEYAGRFHGIFRDHVFIHGVPSSYKPRKAKYKARALEWFRIDRKIQDDDWVLYLDEETMIDEYTVKTCVEFISKQDSVDLGTGVIHYNGHNYWGAVIPQIGDINRVTDDYGRCQFQANAVQKASLGIHGAFLIASGKVQNAVTWETDCVTEDYWFLLGAMKRGFRIGWVPAIARELSPATIHDFVRQRRRWYSGILTIGELDGLFLLYSWLWCLLGPLYCFYCLVTERSITAVPWWLIHSFTSMCVSRQGMAPVPLWFFRVIVFEMAQYTVYTTLSLFLQDWDAGIPWTSMIYTQILCNVLRPFVNLADGYAVLTTFLSPEKEFFVIRKK
ncbi:glycosyl transferase family group 2-domain-containing protein [Hypoxylon fragiforme]|uniref:glycosyl transferase family group 2-domain-containing protein n=1 Tax=Hypoxylon fragiforme TaxID=63214 RepID=UPI0020C69B33|nr:glycosyl transferase family group 2-domain-containing protein [Hypoxylon fragiforme]KAI2609827.1 glycosyl transferase family group 2-domain-containing protein [Hypoxylon fragiforme]